METTILFRTLLGNCQVANCSQPELYRAANIVQSLPLLIAICQHFIIPYSLCRDGIMPPPDVETVPLGAISSELQTGDLVLFSGATSSGAIIKFFDRAQFSHIGIVSLVVVSA